MNSEILQAKGALSEFKRKYHQLDTEASGLLILIRTLLNPWESDITKLQIDKALSSMNRLKLVHEELASLKIRIKELEESLA
jgi:hypothetical protein